MMEAMRERLAGKMGNANNNAFKLRKLFKMWDSTGSGRVRDTQDVSSGCVRARSCSCFLTASSSVQWQPVPSVRLRVACRQLEMWLSSFCRCSAILKTSG